MVLMPHDISPKVAQPSTWQALWLIARRGAIESLRDRMTLIISLLFAIGGPVMVVQTVVRFQTAVIGPGEEAAVGRSLAIFFLILGLAPTTGAVGIASGQFAGEKEAGSLTPLLASPASNVAIFGGKILAAVIPALLYAAVAELTFLLNLVWMLGWDGVAFLPRALSLTLLALVPVIAIFFSAVASIVSSRVRTFNTAQQISGLVVAPVSALVILLAFNLARLGVRGMVLVLLACIAVDLIVVIVAARTWRREEVLAGN